MNNSPQDNKRPRKPREIQNTKVEILPTLDVELNETDFLHTFRVTRPVYQVSHFFPFFFFLVILMELMFFCFCFSFILTVTRRTCLHTVNAMILLYFYLSTYFLQLDGSLCTYLPEVNY